MRIRQESLQDIYLVLLAIGFFVLMATIFAPFVATLLLAVIFAATFQPMYKSIEKVTNKDISSVLTTLIVVLIVVIPLTFLILVIVGELSTFGIMFSQWLTQEFAQGQGLENFVERVNSFLNGINFRSALTVDAIEQGLISSLGNLGTYFSNFFIGFAQNLAALILQLLIFIFALVFLFRDFSRLPKFINRYIPLDDKLERRLFHEFIETGKSVMRGTFLVAIIHAVLISIVFTVFGVQGVGLLFVLLFLAGLIPGGTQFVWFPVGIVVFFTMGWQFSLPLLIISFISMNIIDTFVRPTIMQGSGTKIHPLISLVSIIGGLIVYGPIGLLYGPLIAVMFVTVMNAYNDRFKIAASS